MTTLIRIDRSTIRKNPNAGNTITYIQGPKIVSGVIHGEMPEEYKDRFVISSCDYALDEPIRQSFFASGDVSDILQALIDDKRISELTVDGGWQTIHHAPDPDYLYEYEDTPVPCQQCKQLIPVSAIQIDYESDEIGDLCPNCEGINTFDREYERIGDAIAK